MNKFVNENIERIKEIYNNSTLNEGKPLNKVQLRDTNYSHLKYDYDGTQNDYINSPLLEDLNKAGMATNVIITITTAKTGHGKHVKNSKRTSRHMSETAVDIAILNGIGDKHATDKSFKPEFRELGNKVKDYLVNNLGYTWNVESGNDKAVLWLTYVGGNHYNHLHVSNRSGLPSDESATDDQKLEIETGTEEKELLNKILDSEYLGMKVKDWLEVSKKPENVVDFILKMLDW